MPSGASYQSRDVQHFEKWSPTYENSWMQSRLFSRVHQAVLDLATPSPPPTQVLDVGCGTGRLLRAARTRWPETHLIGVDPAQGMVDEAQRLTPGATILRGLAEELPLPDAGIDLAFSTISSHHWRDPAKGIKEIARVLRPGGHFILADFAMPRVLAWLTLHPGGLTAADRRRLFTAAGLSIQRQQTAVYPFILVTLATRS
jgi:ubiquinone/menaquinone biosynthesis C-methylase UbiE